MYRDLPIEQLLRRKDTRFQYGFATQAKALVPQGDEFALAASHNGLHVLARNEEGLAAPVEVLRDTYGADLEVQPPRVRLLEGVQIQQPIMHVRISLKLRDAAPVKRVLHRRGATLSEEYARSNYCVLRYQAPLADLLGLPGELDSLTEGSAKHWIVLSHYALVTRDPGGKAA